MLLVDAPSDWVLFFGHLHPVLVHLPIGFLLVAGFLELGRRLGKLNVGADTVRAVLFLSAVSATLASGFGYLLSLAGGYEQELLAEHQWQGIVVTVFAWIAWAAKSDWLLNRFRFLSLLDGPALLIAVGFMLIAGHHGGSLTHGSDYLTSYTPEPMRSFVGMPPRKEADVVIKPLANVNQALVFSEVVNPILQARCVQCHNAEKAKGELRFDTAEMLRKGGENGPVYVSGRSSESQLLKRCLLPLDDDDHMPPRGKTQLTPQQLTLLAWWIDQGASFTKRVAELPVTEAVRPALAGLGGGQQTPGQVSPPPTGPAPEPAVLTRQVAVSSPAALEAARRTGLLATPLSETQNQLVVSAVNAKNFSDAQAAVLPALHEQLVWLNLSQTAVGDAAMLQIGKLNNLHKLHLEQTRITDAGLKHLKNLKNLTYLNLYGTAVSDVGLPELTSLKNLRTLYLWQTKVSPAGITRLQKALPGLEIVGGMNEQAIAAFTDSTSSHSEGR